ncbi:Outer-membrane lipoprotein carrier protein [Rhodocyclaceae bacterium]|nr:Outer-membrane lipoprotein carrier protein [Rhodocyclaceae bacterium]
MPNTIRISVLIAGLLASSIAFAAGLDQLKTFLEATKSAQGVFAQSVSAKSGRKPQQSAGSFALQRPGKFRWVYEKPYRQLLVSDGEKLWSYDPDLNQVTVRRLGKALGSSPAALLAGGDLDAHFVLKEAGQADGLEMVDATPKGSDGSFERVRIGFRDNLPRIMEIRDNFGQVTTLLFAEFHPNPPLPKDLFRFTPPKGADVVGE